MLVGVGISFYGCIWSVMAPFFTGHDVGCFVIVKIKQFQTKTHLYSRVYEYEPDQRRYE